MITLVNITLVTTFVLALNSIVDLAPFVFKIIIELEDY